MSNNARPVYDMQMIPYVAHEGAMVRLERTNRRLWIVVIILILALLATNSAWLYYESQMEDVYVTQEAESSDSSTLIMTNGGSVEYGD